jgi:hypothetical protein
MGTSGYYLLLHYGYIIQWTANGINGLAVGVPVVNQWQAIDVHQGIDCGALVCQGRPPRGEVGFGPKFRGHSGFSN